MLLHCHTTLGLVEGWKFMSLPFLSQDRLYSWLQSILIGTFWPFFLHTIHTKFLKCRIVNLLIKQDSTQKNNKICAMRLSFNRLSKKPSFLERCQHSSKHKSMSRRHTFHQTTSLIEEPLYLIPHLTFRQHVRFPFHTHSLFL